MDTKTFETLQAGDKIQYRGETYEILFTEHAYDYSQKPARQYTWKVHFDNGTNAQIDDDIRGLEPVIVLEPESIKAPVIVLDSDEVVHFGGKAEDTERIASKVGNILMDLGYWDVLKQVIEELED